MKLFSSLKQRAVDFLEPYKEKGPATYAAAEQAIGAILIADGLFGLENPFGSKKRPGIFGTFSGMLAGAIFMFVPVVIGNLSNVNNMTATSPATVVSVGDMVRTGNSKSGTCSLVADYIVNGQKYTTTSSMSSSGYCSLSVGQTISISYAPNDPSVWVHGASAVKNFLRIFFWVGVFLLVSSIVTFFIRLFSIIFGWKLLRDGRRNAATLPQGTNLQTIINEIKQNFTSSVFGFGQSNTTMPPNMQADIKSVIQNALTSDTQPKQ